MNKINYKESINIGSDIQELILINLDENISSQNEEDFINFNGEIRISGEVKTSNENIPFSHPLTIDISLSKQQLINDSPSISVDDFIYQINQDNIDIELSLKIDGLKEMETEFPSQEDEDIIPLQEIIEPQETMIEEEIIEKKESSLLDKIFKRYTKTEKAYLIHVVKDETSYEDIATLYDTTQEILKTANTNKDIKPGALIFIPNNK